ncbi:MAG: hypothetical protein GC155_03900 [Alphaproteobacteria bacterium]|nr:hypothetical protein [Alphaproteobacteria bacterium]
MIRTATGLALAALLAACSPNAAAPNASAPAASADNADKTPYKIDFEIKDVMDNVIDFAADNMWAKQGWDVDEKGEHPLFPTTEEEWANAAKETATLAEAANLLMLPGRAVDNDRWIKQATKLHEAAMEEYRAIKARDTEKMFSVGSEIFIVCRDCHAMYILGEEPPK